MTTWMNNHPWLFFWLCVLALIVIYDAVAAICNTFIETRK